jgi:hypothetical protein
MKPVNIAVIVFGLSMAAALPAETLLIERAQKAQVTATPARGSTMDTVRAQYGEPTQAHAAVGQPPITRWDYPAFAVYFEHQHVINSVLHKSHEFEMGPRRVAQPAR